MPRERTLLSLRSLITSQEKNSWTYLTNRALSSEWEDRRSPEVYIFILDQIFYCKHITTHMSLRWLYKYEFQKFFIYFFGIMPNRVSIVSFKIFPYSINTSLPKSFPLAVSISEVGAQILLNLGWLDFRSSRKRYTKEVLDCVNRPWIYSLRST